MNRNKLIAVILSLALLLAPVGTPAAAAGEKKLNIVATIFPIYDWTREILGDPAQAELTLLLGNGVDMHSFQPTVADIMKIATCDVFIYTGGESDAWVKDALREATNPNQIAISLLDALGNDVKAEELLEGMEPEHEHETAAEEDTEADEHVWLSLRNAQKLVQAIAVKLAEADPSLAEAWLANAAAYCDKLAGLDAQYAETTRQATHHSLLFGDRFPFRYLADDYGLTCYAAFAGCSAETEASFQTIIFLAQKIDELGLPAVMTIEGSDHKIAETVIQATAGKNQKILTLNSMQGVTNADIQAGITYLTLMQANLAVLQEALN